MKAILVRGTEKGTFLDQVVAFAVDHKILSIEKRLELVRASAEYHGKLCADLGMNARSTDETLVGCRRLVNLISLGLELSSGGNIEVAAKLVAEQDFKQIAENAFVRLNSLRERARRYTADVQGSYILLSTQLQVTVCFARREGIYLHGDAGVIEFWDPAFFVDRLKTSADLAAAEAVVTENEKELELSLKYLPWEQMRKFLKLKPAKDREFMSPLVFGWGIESLMNTLAVTLQLRDKWRGKTGLPWDVFRKQIGRIGANKFRKEAFDAAKQYLEGCVPRPNEDEEQFLLAIWREAILRLAETSKSRFKDDLDVWSHHVHLIIRPTQIGLAATSLPGEEREEKKLDVFQIEHLRDEDVRKSGLLGRLNWDGMSSTDFESLLDSCEPETVIRYVPLEARFLKRIIERWGSWEKRACRSLVSRVLNKTPARFWKDTPFEVLQAIGGGATSRQLKKFERRMKNRK